MELDGPAEALGDEREALGLHHTPGADRQLLSTCSADCADTPLHLASSRARRGGRTKEVGPSLDTDARLRDNEPVSGLDFFETAIAASSTVPTKVSSRTLRAAIEQTLIDAYTRRDLETVLGEELQLPWTASDYQPSDRHYTKRALVQAYTEGWELPRLVALARRIVAELDLSDATVAALTALLSVYDRGGGVGAPAKDLIFAANGPKPELVLRDAVNNDIEIVRNGEYCLVYDLPIPADGLTFSNLIEWWRERQGVASSVSARDVGIDLHGRLRASLGDNPAERRVFDAYATRYKDEQFDVPALIPQVYLHFDPATQLARRTAGRAAAHWHGNGWTSSSCSPAGTASSSKSTGSSTTHEVRSQAPRCTARWSPRTDGSSSPDTRSTGSVGPNS